jgi:hypothetical protein
VLLVVLSLTASTACNAVFGLDELGEGSEERDGGPDVVRRQVTFSRDRLTAGAVIAESPTPTAVRYLVRDSAEPLGYASYPATIDGASASADVPPGPYLLEIQLGAGAPLYLASDAATFAYRDRVYGRADLVTTFKPRQVSFSLQSTLWNPSESALHFDTIGMWSHARAMDGSVTGTGATTDPLRWNLPWSLDAVTTPPGAPFGLLDAGDWIAITHRRGDGDAWSVVEAYAAAIAAPQGGVFALTPTLTPVTPTRIDLAVADSLLGRARATAPAAAACTGQAEVRLVPSPETGNTWGIGLGGATFAGGGTVSVSAPSSIGLPSSYARRLVTIVDCPYTLSSSDVAVHAEYAVPVEVGGAIELPIPFASGFEVAGAPLSAGESNVRRLPAGAVTVRWMPESGLNAPDLYSVVVAALGTSTPVPVFTALTKQPSIDVPAGLIEPGSYVVLVTAAVGYPGFGTGELTPSGAPGSTTTPSPLVTFTQ